jgi:hypothetical protein
MEHVAMRIPVGCIIAHDWRPLFTELSLDLGDEVDNLPTIDFKANSQSIVLIQESTKLHPAHTTLRPKGLVY